jgi:hypothetical protein
MSKRVSRITLTAVPGHDSRAETTKPGSPFWLFELAPLYTKYTKCEFLICTLAEAYSRVPPWLAWRCEISGQSGGIE